MTIAAIYVSRLLRWWRYQNRGWGERPQKSLRFASEHTFGGLHLLLPFLKRQLAATLAQLRTQQPIIACGGIMP
jgi:hypothetical protein